MIKKLKTLPLNTYTLFIVLGLLFVPLVYSTRIPDPSLSIRQLALNLLLLGFVVGIIIIQLRGRKTPDLSFLQKRIFLYYLVYLLIAGISIFFAVNQPEAVYEWVKLVGFFLFFILLTYSLSIQQNPIQLTIKLIIVLAVSLCTRGIYEIIIFSTEGAFDHQTSYLIKAYSSNRNLYGQFIFLCFPFTAYGVVRLKSWWKVAAAITSFAILVLSVMLLVRSVWLAFFIASTTTIILYFIFSKSTFFRSKFIIKSGFTLIIFVLIISTGVFIFSRFGDPRVFEEQFYWLKNFNFGSSLERIELWKKSVAMGLDHFWIGVGQGNWRIILPEYGFENIRAGAENTFFQRPHNDFLWVWCENGIVGLLFYCLIVFSTFKYLISALRNTKTSFDSLFIYSLFFSFTAYLVFSLLSFPKERIEHQLFFHMYLAFAVLAIPSKKVNTQIFKRGSQVVMLVVLLMLISFASYMSYCRVKGEIHLLDAYKYRQSNQFNQVVKEIEQAVGFCFTIDGYSTPLQWYKGEAHFILGNNDRAFEDFNKAYSANPNHIHVLNNLATSYEIMGKHYKAKSLYKKAMGILPGFEDPLLNLTAIYYNEKNTDSALYFLSRISLENENTRYPVFREAVLYQKLEVMINTSNERIIFKSIERISRDKDWMIKVFLQSKELHESFETSVYKEVIFLLESVDSTISPSDALAYRLKYNL